MGLTYALIGGFVTARYGLSPLVGYLLAGVAVGPFTPGFVADTKLLGKSMVACLLVLAFRYPLSAVLMISASLAQIGEFSFILAGLGFALHLLPDVARDLILAGALLSMTLNPFVFRLVGAVQRRNERRVA